MQAAANDAGSSSKKNTVYVAGFPAEVKEQQLLDAFVTFGELLPLVLFLYPSAASSRVRHNAEIRPGDILEVNLPTEPNERESSPVGLFVRDRG